MTVKPWDELQLRFELPELDEVEEDAALRAITPEQARQISEAARTAFSGQQSAEKVGWFDDYMMLIGQGWPWRVAAYIAWAGSPKIGREPRTLKELATEVLGLTSERVIYTWRKKYASIDGIVSMMHSAPLFEHRRGIYEAMIAVATAPDYKGFNDRKLALEILGDYVPRSKMQISGTAKDLSELSDDELDRLLGEELTTEAQSARSNDEEEGEE